jgi:integrase
MTRPGVDKPPQGLFTERDNKNAPAARQRPGADTEGVSFDARKTLRHLWAAILMKDRRHEKSAAWPELEAYLSFRAIDMRPRSLHSYDRQIAIVLRDWPDTPFDQITTDQLNKSLGHLALRNLRSAYITRSIWSGWFKWGESQGRITRNPMHGVARPKQPARRPDAREYFSATEIEALEGLPSPDGALCGLMLGSGLRKIECRQLRRKHVDLLHPKGPRLYVFDGKGGKDRMVPLPLPVATALEELFILEGINPDDYIWATHPGGGTKVSRANPVSATTFDRWWRGDPRINRSGICERAGIRYLNTHQTRYTYGAVLRQRGFSLEAIKLLMGHEKIATTIDLYGTLHIEDVAIDMAAMWVRDDA